MCQPLHMCAQDTLQDSVVCLFTNTTSTLLCRRLLSHAHIVTSPPPHTQHPSVLATNQAALEYEAIIMTHAQTVREQFLECWSQKGTRMQALMPQPANKHPRTCCRQQKDSSDSAHPSETIIVVCAVGHEHSFSWCVLSCRVKGLNQVRQPLHTLVSASKQLPLQTVS